MGNELILKLGLSGLTNVTSGLGSLRASVVAATRSISSITGPLAAAFAGVAGAAGGMAAFTAGIKDIVELGGHLKDQSTQTGVAVGKLMQYRQALADTGIGADSVGMVLSRMNRDIAQAFDENGPAAKGIRDLGLDIGVLVSMSPADQFEKMAEAISKLPTPAQRTAAAMQIFGRSGSELIPFFSDAGALGEASRTLGRLPQILQRNAGILDSIGDSFSHIKTKVQQFFAGVLDLVGPMIQPLIDRINDLDLTGLGQEFGAFVVLAQQMWQDGKFSEFLGLVIEAGFELGAIGARKVFDKLLDWLGSADFWKTIGNAFLTMLNGAMKAAGSLFVTWAGAIAGQVIGIAEILATKLGDPTATSEADVARMQVKRAQQLGNKAIGGFFDDSTQAGRDLMGINNRPADLTAYEELMRRINAILNQNEATHGRAVVEEQKGVAVARQSFNLAEQEHQAKEELLALEIHRSKVESDFRLTDAQKFALKKADLEYEKSILEDIVALIERRATSESDPKVREQLVNRADSFRSQLGGKERELAHLGPDPNSFSEQWSAAFTQLQNEWGTVAQNIAEVGKSAFQSLTRTIGQGLDDMIWKTGSLRDLWKGFAHTLTSTVTQAIAKMFMQWITSIFAKATAEETAAAGETAAKTPVALLDSISSYGVAAAVGAAALIAAMALIPREGGGPVMPGQAYLVGEKRPEVFVPSRSGVILPRVEDGMFQTPKATGAAGAPDVHIYVVNSAEEVMRAIESSPRGRKMVVNAVKGSKLDLGIST